MTVNLDGVNHEAASGPLIAHEMGHILGKASFKSVVRVIKMYFFEKQKIESLVSANLLSLELKGVQMTNWLCNIQGFVFTQTWLTLIDQL